MTTFAHLVSNSGIITLVLGTKSYTITTDHPNYKSIVKALSASDVKKLATLVDIPKAITQYASPLGKVSVEDGEVLYEGKPLHNAVTSRIMELMEGGYPIKPLILFLENLMQNPSKRSVDELYDFLDHQKLPITDDGHFLCYKGTRSDGLDRYSGTVMNGIGDIIEMPRNQVDDDRSHECSHGYHVGTIAYVKGYCTARMIICKVNPRDAVSVPQDHNCQKLRVCRYQVVGLYEGDLDQAPVYSGYDARPLTEEDWPTDEDYVDVDVSDYDLEETDDGKVYYARRGSDGRFVKRS